MVWVVGLPQFGQNVSPCPSWVPQYWHEGMLALLRNIRAVKVTVGCKWAVCYCGVCPQGWLGLSGLTEKPLADLTDLLNSWRGYLGTTALFRR